MHGPRLDKTRRETMQLGWSFRAGRGGNSPAGCRDGAVGLAGIGLEGGGGNITTWDATGGIMV